jgi:hypothetical protein
VTVPFNLAATLVPGAGVVLLVLETVTRMSFAWPGCNTSLGQLDPALGNTFIVPAAWQPAAEDRLALSNNVKLTPRRREMLKRSNRNFLNFPSEGEATKFVIKASPVGDEPEFLFIS